MKNFFVLLALLMSVQVYAQFDIDFKLSEPVKVSKRAYDVQFITNDDESLILTKLEKGSENAHFSLHDADLNHLSSIEKWGDYTEILRLGSNFYVINEEDRDKLLFYPINEKPFSISETAASAIDLPSYSAVQASAKGIYRQTFVRTSPDKSKFVVVSDKRSRGGEIRTVMVSVYNANFDLLWTKDITTGIKRKFFKYKDVHLNDEGNVLISVDEILLESVAKKNRSSARIFLIKEEGTFSYKLKFKNSRQQLTDFTIIDSDDGKLQFAFLIEEDVKGKKRPKSFLQRVSFDDELDVIKQPITALNMDKLVPIPKIGVASRKRGEKLYNEVVENYKLHAFDFLKIRHVLNFTNGNQLMLMEYFNNETVQASHATQGNYAFGLVYAVMLDQEGAIKYVTIIPKYQANRNPRTELASFDLLYNEDHAYLIYNDNINNDNFFYVELLSLRGPALKKYQLKAVQLDLETGKIALKQLSSSEDDGVLVIPTHSLKLKDGSLISMGKIDKAYRSLIKFELPD